MFNSETYLIGLGQLVILFSDFCNSCPDLIRRLVVFRFSLISALSTKSNAIKKIEYEMCARSYACTDRCFVLIFCVRVCVCFELYC